MSDDFTNDSLLELYLFESTTLLDSLDSILLEAESARRLTQESINEIFRIMHTIKGSSAMMEYNTIAEVAHRTEDLFSIIRDNGIEEAFFDELFDLVLHTSEFLEGEITKIQEGSELASENPQLVESLSAFIEKLNSGKPEKPTPDVGRTLGGFVSAPPPTHRPEPVHQPEPVRQPEPETHQPEPMRQPEPETHQPEPVSQPAYKPDPVTMPFAPEGGRMLGIEPEPARSVQPPSVPAEAPVIPRTSSRTVVGAANVPKDASQTYYLHIHFDEGAKMENIRAYMLVNKLSEMGTIVRTIPDSLENNNEAAYYIVENGFYIAFSTTMFREQIETVTKGTLSVESVSFVRRMPDESPEQPASVPTSAPAQNPAPNFAPAPAQTPVQPTPAPVSGPVPTPVSVAAPVPVSVPAPVPVSASEPEARPDRPGIQPAGTYDIEDETGEFEPVSEYAPSATAAISEPAVTYSESAYSTGPAPAAPAAPAAIGTRTPAAAFADLQAGVQTGKASKQNIISVDLTKLDSLLDLVGEIVINESMVTENPDLVGLELEGFNKAARQLNKLTDELQDTVMSVRMVPVATTFQRMRRIVRDMSKRLGKNAELVLLGENTEVDKTILDALGDPIMHLVRNAMDHAIETPSEREQAGKSPVGHITLSAQNVGGDVIISVSDDGHGLDSAGILAKARARGILRKPESEYSEKEIYGLLMAPGFSTKENVTEFSGRGVGLDVVKSNIERIGGSVIVESVKGVGTNVLLKIPLTLAIISCMELQLGDDIFSIPITNIRESVKASAGQLISDPVGNEMIMLRGNAYPIVRLYESFNTPNAIQDIDEGILILADSGDKLACLLVDKLIGKFQVVVKPIPRFLKQFEVKKAGISGCTIMGNGDISLIIDVQELLA